MMCVHKSVMYACVVCTQATSQLTVRGNYSWSQFQVDSSGLPITIQSTSQLGLETEEHMLDLSQLLDLTDTVWNPMWNGSEGNVTDTSYRHVITPHSMLHKGLSDWFCPWVFTSTVSHAPYNNYRLFCQWLSTSFLYFMCMFIYVCTGVCVYTRILQHSML